MTTREELAQQQLATTTALVETSAALLQAVTDAVARGAHRRKTPVKAGKRS